MKAILRTFGGRGWAELNFDRLVPLFPRTARPNFWMPEESSFVLNRRGLRKDRAAQMALRNLTRFPIEIVRPVSSCRKFLSGLFGEIEGLELVQRTGDYQLRLEHGICFEVGVVGREVAELFRASFYPDEAMEFIDETPPAAAADEPSMHDAGARVIRN